MIKMKKMCKWNSEGMCIFHDHLFLGSKICRGCKEPFKTKIKNKIFCNQYCKDKSKKCLV